MMKQAQNGDVPVRGRSHWSWRSGVVRIMKLTPQSAWFLLVVILLAAPIIYYLQRRLIEDRIVGDEQANVRLIARDLEQRLYPVINDLLIGSEYFKEQEPAGRGRVDWKKAGQGMRWLSRRKREYSLYRIFDLSGQEVVVYDNRTDRLHVPPDPQLHYRGHRYFVQEILKLDRGDFYVSPLDLLFNRATNQVEQPLQPTMRIGVALYNLDGEKIGLLLVNLDGRYVLDCLNPHRSDGVGLSLLDDKGYWLKSPVAGDEWGWQLPGGEQKTMRLRNPAVWRVISGGESGVARGADGVYVFGTARPLNRIDENVSGLSISAKTRSVLNNYQWKVVVWIPQERFLVATRGLFWWCFGCQCAALALLIAAVFWLIRQRKARLGAEMDLQQKAHLLDLAQDAICVIDRDQKILYWNDGAAAQYGWSREEAIGRQLNDLLKSSFYVTEQEISDSLIRTGRWEGEVLHKARNGESVISNCRLALQRNGEDGAPLVLIISHDITQRKRNLEALELVSRENALYFESVPSLLIALDESGVIMRWNRAAKQALGLNESEVLGRFMPTCGVAWLDENFGEQLAKCMRDGGGELRRIRFMRDKETCFLKCRVLSLDRHSGARAGFLLAGEDVTERLGLEQQLRQAQKMEAIGQLAAGIAHEINTPTQYVGDNTIFLKQSWENISNLLQAGAFLRQQAPEDASLREALESYDRAAEEADLEYIQEEIPRALDQTLEGVHRVAKIVRAMKEFSHPGAEDKKAVDLNHAIETTVTVARNEWKYVSEVQLDLDPNLPPVECLAGEFNQVMLNLLVNAAYAIGEKNHDAPEIKGLIEISTRRDENWAEIRVRDTGGGIPEAIQHRIFEPFFTTKDVGKGTGQGLAFAHAVIVKKHGGKIWFECTEGVGSTFIIRMPINAGEGGSDDHA